MSTQKSTSRKWSESRFAAVYMMLAGLVLAGAGVWIVGDTQVFLSHADRAAGTVVSLAKVRGAKGTRLYHAIVQYHRPEADETVTFKSRPGLNPSPFSVGDHVTVAYRSSDPVGARVISFWTLWFLPCAMIALGGGCVFAGRSTLIKRLRESANTR